MESFSSILGIRASNTGDPPASRKEEPFTQELSLPGLGVITLVNAVAIEAKFVHGRMRDYRDIFSLYLSGSNSSLID